jgi:hypothetical protein
MQSHPLVEALEPGKPLSFLDHYIRCGNSLLGTTPELIAAGLSDDAFEAIEGGDKAACASLKKLNREQHEGLRHMFIAEDTANRIAPFPSGQPDEKYNEGTAPLARVRTNLAREHQYQRFCGAGLSYQRMCLSLLLQESPAFSVSANNQCESMELAAD